MLSYSRVNNLFLLMQNAEFHFPIKNNEVHLFFSQSPESHNDIIKTINDIEGAMTNVNR